MDRGTNPAVRDRPVCQGVPSGSATVNDAPAGPFGAAVRVPS